MTVLSGAKVASVLSKTTSVRLSAELGELTVDYWQTPRYSDHPTHTKEMRAFTRAFTWTAPYNLPVSAGLGQKPGEKALSYLDDLYYRVHVKPRLIDFGNLINTEIRPLVIWNATFEFQLMLTPTESTQPGISMALPADVATPYVLKPTEEIVADVKADIEGPPTVDSTFTLTIGGTAYVVRSVGRRILLWPFPPNWGNQVDDSYVFRSWALRSADGHVQSGSQWGNAPRRELEYTSLLLADDAQRAENLLFGWQGRFYGVVCWPDRSNLTAAVAAGTREIPCDTTDRAFAPGGFAVIYVDTTTYESVEIESVTAAGITVTSDLKDSWPSGSRVYPVFAGLINASIAGSRKTDSVIELPVSFECEPSTTYGNTPVGPATPTYRGEELYLGKLNWAAALPFDYTSDRQKLDVNAGKFYSFTESDFTPLQKEHTWLFASRAEAQAFRNWLGRREGVARPVYMPTGNTDFTLVADPLPNSGYLDVADTEYKINAAHPARRDIIMVMRDGSYFARRITSVEPAPSGNGSRIFLDTTWPSTPIDRAKIKRISFLGLFRQVGNKTTIRWHTETKGTASLRLITDRTD